MPEKIIMMDTDAQMHVIIESTAAGKNPMVIAETDDIDYAGDIVERLNSSPLRPGYTYYHAEKEG